MINKINKLSTEDLKLHFKLNKRVKDEESGFIKFIEIEN